VGAVDEATHTLYSSDPSSDTVSVINTATCNSTNTKGCSAVPPTITVGPFPGPPALDPVTRTLYVPYGSAPNYDQVAVVNAATCNAKDTNGCAQSPGSVTVGPHTFFLAVSVKTNTVYAPSVANNTVAVINGATCNGTDHLGCGTLAATVNVGATPIGVAIDDLTHTVYVPNNANGDSPGTLAMINSATCNGSDTASCGGPMPTVGVGRSPFLATVNTATDVVYVTDYNDATVSVLNGSRCNAMTTSGCGSAVTKVAVGSSPQQPVLDQDNNTVYVTTQPGSLSILRETRHSVCPHAQRPSRDHRLTTAEGPQPQRARPLRCA